MSIGIPIKLLHEAEGHIVTVETTTGEVYRGKLLEAEDNMNVQLQNITMTSRDGRVTQLEQVFIRGSMIRFLIVPDMLKNAPMFKPRTGAKGVSSGAGRGAIQRGEQWRFEIFQCISLALVLLVVTACVCGAEHVCKPWAAIFRMPPFYATVIYNRNLQTFWLVRVLLTVSFHLHYTLIEQLLLWLSIHLHVTISLHTQRVRAHHDLCYLLYRLHTTLLCRLFCSILISLSAIPRALMVFTCFM